MTRGVPGLHRLARLHGVQTSYRDASGNRQEAGQEVLLAVLKALGAPVEGAADVSRALRERRQALWHEVLPRATVVWDGTIGSVDVRLPRRWATGILRGTLALEEGEQSELWWELDALTPSMAGEVEGEDFLLYRLSLRASLPAGYHRLFLDLPAGTASTMVIAAPVRCAAGPKRDCGVFLPLHGLRSSDDWGIGDYSGLRALSEWSAGLGASIVGTLPLLPTFLDEPVEPSPYAPITRLAWNPIFVDVSRAPGADGAEAAAALNGMEAFHAEKDGLRQLEHVDYRRVMALKRRVMERLSLLSENRETARRFAAQRPLIDVYAKFMAVREAQGRPWREWPERLRGGVWKAGDYGEEAWLYHVYAQMAASEQMEEERSVAGGPGLYLDYPVGVHPDGFDVWREQKRFVTEVTVGAPPDSFFTSGQDWGFNPLHPERSGDHGYLIAGLRHHMRHASLLRLDHVMGLHRLYWVPRDAAPTDGAYVRYPAEEQYAVLAIESNRHQTGVVGEDLGTVPSVVPRAMARHGLKRMFVLQFSVGAGGPEPVVWPSKGMVASANTHDTPTFAGYWRGLDIADRRDLGLLDYVAAARAEEQRGRERAALLEWLRGRRYLTEDRADEHAVMRAIHRALAASRADLVLVNLEDLWLERHPQNVPGTSTERPNWLRKARYTVEEFMRLGSVRDLLTELAQLRRRKNER